MTSGAEHFILVLVGFIITVQNIILHTLQQRSEHGFICELHNTYSQSSLGLSILSIAEKMEHVIETQSQRYQDFVCEKCCYMYLSESGWWWKLLAPGLDQVVSSGVFLDCLPGDSFTVSMHSTNGRQMPAFSAVQGTVSIIWKLMEISTCTPPGIPQSMMANYTRNDTSQLQTISLHEKLSWPLVQSD